MTTTREPAAKTTAARPRVASLDGLRGVAAVVVLFHHSLLTVPTLALAYYPRQGEIATGTAAWFLTYTPLHLVWAGPEAVALFFVLSGIVLTLPVLHSERFSWLAYYPKRVVRLYGPVVAAVFIGFVWVLAVPRYNTAALGAWMNARPNDYTSERLLRDLTLLNGTSGMVSPLWSLQWEVLFSLALPLYVLFARAPVPGWLKFVTAIALISWGLAGHGPHFYYLPMFALGAVIVAHWDRLERLAAQLDARPGAWAALLVVAALLTCSRWELDALGLSAAEASSWRWVSVLGVTLLVLAAAFCPQLRGLLQRRVIQWLGVLSFSLYLVHEPIVIAVRYLTLQHSPWLGMVISVPLSLLAAMAFARVVEKPSQQLARRIGQRLSGAPLR